MWEAVWVGGVRGREGHRFSNLTHKPNSRVLEEGRTAEQANSRPSAVWQAGCWWWEENMQECRHAGMQAGGRAGYYPIHPPVRPAHTRHLEERATHAATFLFHLLRRRQHRRLRAPPVAVTPLHQHMHRLRAVAAVEFIVPLGLRLGLVPVPAPAPAPAPGTAARQQWRRPQRRHELTSGRATAAQHGRDSRLRCSRGRISRAASGGKCGAVCLRGRAQRLIACYARRADGRTGGRAGRSAD